MIDMAVNGLLIGVIATAGLDIWAVAAKRLLHLPTANWAMVGRWFGHMPRGVLVHQSIATAAPVRNELLIGWVGHYVTGIVYGLTYLLVLQLLSSGTPSLLSAVGFGLATLAAPWLIMQPAMGAGVFATRASRPNVVRLVNLSMHVVFGAGLYLGWLLIP